MTDEPKPLSEEEYSAWSKAGFLSYYVQRCLATIAADRREIVLLKAAHDGAMSMLLSVQQDCIAAVKERDAKDREIDRLRKSVDAVDKWWAQS